MAEKIAVLGAGSWGSVLANMLVENGHQVIIWSRDADQAKQLNDQHINPKYMPKLTYQTALKATNDLKQALTGATMVLLAIPTGGLLQVASKVDTILDQLDERPLLVHATKGLEQKSYKRPSQMISEEIAPEHRLAIVALTGPSHAEDVAVHDMTAVTAASENMDYAIKVQDIFSNPNFRVYTNNDLIGAEFGGALKNIIAIGSGALRGLGYGDDARAALITRGLAEIRRLGVAFGANPLTFSGLSGVGDLVVTATSRNSRNWRAGYQLGKGEKLEDVIEGMGMVIEGVYTTKAAYELSQKRHVKMPITDALYAVLYEGASTKEEITELMSRGLGSEVE